MPNEDRAPWWKGARGEWLVLVQLVLMALVFFGPRDWPGMHLRFPVAGWVRIGGGALMAAGLALLMASFVRLGRNTTPLPYPREHGALVVSGPYALVRHPMYGGGIILAAGWAVVVGSLLTAAYALVLAVFLDFKSRREERWLLERYAGYAEYRRRVRKLIPFVY